MCVTLCCNIIQRSTNHKHSHLYAVYYNHYGHTQPFRKIPQGRLETGTSGIRGIALNY